MEGGMQWDITGLVLSSVLFNISINDLVEGIKGMLTKYAKFPNTPEDRIKIQKDLNKMLLSHKNIKVLQLGRKKQLCSSHTYKKEMGPCRPHINQKAAVYCNY